MKEPDALNPYAQTRKEKNRASREARKREKRDGRMEERNLAFFAEIMRRLGHNQTTFAQAAGTTKQNVGHYFLADDVKLSVLQTLLHNAGVDLTVDYEGADASEPTYGLVWDGVPVTRPIVGPPSVTSLVEQRLAPSSRTAFFARLVLHEGMPLDDFCNKAEMPMSRLRTLLTTDDMKVSEIIRCGDNFGHRVVWRVDRVSSD